MSKGLIARAGLATHTPGPWKVRGGGANVFSHDIVGPNGEDIAYVNESDGADEPTMYPVEANERLISAAPDLLAALKEITFRLACVCAATGDFSEANAQALDQASVAMQKALGEL